MKVYVTIPPPGSFSEPTPRRFLFSLQHDQSISNCASGLSDLRTCWSKHGSLTNMLTILRLDSLGVSLVFFLLTFSKLMMLPMCICSLGLFVLRSTTWFKHPSMRLTIIFSLDQQVRLWLALCQGKYTIPRIRCLALIPPGAWFVWRSLKTEKD